jgi:methionyl aminopeptidase
VTIDSKGDLVGMRAVGRLVGRALQEMKNALRPGMTTAQLDDIGAAFLRKHGARSAPQLTYNFPGFNCISVNDEIVHGVPGPRRIVGGDVVKIDVTAELDGLIADSAISVLVPPISPRGLRLVRCARSAFDRALSRAAAELRIAELGRTVEDEVNRWGHSVVRDMTGHGVGRALHEEPAVPNFYSPFIPGRLAEGMVIALEPIISERPTALVEGDDGWTIRTANGCLAAHHEHTIVIREGGAEVLTLAA